MNDLDSIYKRWNIKIDQNHAFTMFKNRVLNFLDNISSMSLSNEFFIVKRFSDNAGIISPTFQEFYFSYGSKEFYLFFYTHFSTLTGFSDLCIYLQLLINAIYEVLIETEKDPDKIRENKDKFLIIGLQLNRIFGLSSFLNAEIHISDKGISIFPSGVKLLDEELINKNLDWLQNYPEIVKDFETALQIYLSKDKKKYRNLLDNLRFSLEQLLKKILNNNKSIENQQDALTKWLVSKKANQQIIDMYIQLLFGPYNLYQNNAVKHKSGFSEEDIEFMIYITATFMRLILKLEG